MTARFQVRLIESTRRAQTAMLRARLSSSSLPAFSAKVLGSMRVAFGSYVPALNLMIGMCVIAAGCVIVLARLNQPVRPVTA